MLRLTFILITFLISGCATTNYKSANINSNNPLPSNHGVVALHLTSNTDKLNHVTSKWDRIYVVRLDNLADAKQRAVDSAIKRTAMKGIPQKVDPNKVKWEPDTYTLEPLYKGVIGSQVFVGTMPEGRYAISQLYTRRSDGQFIYTLKMNVMQSAGLFKINASGLTNLGTLVFQPLLDINESSFWYRKQNAYVTRLDTSDRLDNFVINNYPNIAKNLTNKTVLSWEEDAIDPLRFKLGHLSRKFAYADKAISLQGNTIGGMAGRLGQFYLLNQDKTWNKTSFPTNAQIYSALSYNDQTVFGGEFGELFIKNSNGINWERNNPVSATEVIVWMGKGVHSNYALTRSQDSYKIYEFKEPRGKWKNISNLEQESSFWVQNGKIFAFINQQGNLSLISDSKQKEYFHSSKKWNTSKSESLVNLTPSANGVLLALEVSQWDGIGDQVISFDDGKTWSSLDRNLQWNGDHAADKTLPAILNDQTVVTIGRKPKAKGQKSEDHDDSMKVITIPKSKIASPKEWQYRGNTYGNCHTLLPELTNGTTIYFLCPRGKVVSTSNFGETWSTEIEIDYSLMQKEFRNLLINLK